MTSDIAIQHIPLDLIDCRPQVRRDSDEASIDHLAQSIQTAGQLSPVLVRRCGERYTLIFGERRLKAMRKLGLKTIAAQVIEEAMEEADVALRQLLENAQRRDLNPIDQALAVRQLIDAMGWSASQAAFKLGFTPAGVSRALALLQLPSTIQQAVASGAIAPSAGYELSRIEDSDEQSRLAEQLICGSLTRDGLSGALKAVKHRKARPGDSAEVAQDGGRILRATACLGADRSITVSGPQLTLERFIEWLEELLAKARRVRPQGLELGTFLRMLKDAAKA